VGSLEHSNNPGVTDSSQITAVFTKNSAVRSQSVEWLVGWLLACLVGWLVG